MAVPTYWTLEYPTGVERTFDDWNFTQPHQTFQSQARGTFTVVVPGADNLIADPPIPYFGYVIVRRYTFDSGNTPEIVFQGFQVTDRRSASEHPARTLVFVDAWHSLENLVFQHLWKFLDATNTVVEQFFSRVILFQEFTSPWVLMSVGDQIREILNYAITTCGVPLQIGTIDPLGFLPIYPVRAVMCSAALQICLKLQPDAVVDIDPHTSPPTIHVRTRANQAQITLPYADGEVHASSDILPRPDLQVPGVVIQYQFTNTYNGASWITLPIDAYPLGTTGREVGSIVLPLDMRGLSRTDILVKAAAFDPTSTDWWKLKKPELAGANISGLALVAGSVTITDESGVTTALPGPLATLPRELIDGEICDWMNVGVQHVTVSAKFTYTEKDPQNRTVHQVTAANPHVITTRVKITNSNAGVVAYPQYFDAGEGLISGLAQYVYNTLAQLQHEGSHTIVERNSIGQPEVSIIYRTDKLLNLSGGDPRWASMAASVQSVDIDHYLGRTTLNFGPAKHIAPGDLQEILQHLRWRKVIDRPSTRVTGDASAGSRLGGATASENTTEGNPPLGRLRVAADW